MQTFLDKLLRLLFISISFFTIATFAIAIQYAPVVVGDVVTFVPYSHVRVSLGGDRLISEGDNKVLTANVSHPEDVVRYEWREGNRLLSTNRTFSTKNLLVGTHNITLNIVDINRLSISDNIKILIGSKEYVGLRKKAILSNDNYLKFVNAVNYLEHLNWQNLPQFGENINSENHINSRSNVGYKIINYDNYKYGEAIVNGSKRVDIVSIKEYDNYTKRVIKNDFNLTFKTLNSETKLLVKNSISVIDYKDGNQDIDVELSKYFIYDKKHNEYIELIDFDTNNPKLYISSEGYVNIDKHNEEFTIYGKNNSKLMLIYHNEENIFETRKNTEGGTYKVRIYSAKNGQGNISVRLNNLKKDDLFYVPFIVSEYEPPKLYEINGNTQLLEHSFNSWHVNYKLLNENIESFKISIEWYLNGIKVNLPIQNEFYNSRISIDDILKAVIIIKNGDLTIKNEQSSENIYSYGDYPFYTQLDATYNIEYRTNSLEFNFDILEHEYLKDIDLENSQFSWFLESNYGYGTIIKNTKYSQIPIILANKYGRMFDYLYLRIYSKNDIKIVCFNINLLHGSEGYVKNKENIIDSVNEANITNNKYVTTKKLYHEDIDKNNLEDIIYQSETYSGDYLNVSYQISERTFELEKMKIDGNLYLGDFDGDNIKEAFVFSDDLNNSMIISLEKGNIHRVNDINISSVFNRLAIKAVADMNSDGKDDLIVANNQEKNIYIYENLNNINQVSLVGANKCIKLEVEDINGDGLQDIICSPNSSMTYLYTDNYEDYFSLNLVINFYLQNTDHSFSMNSREYSLVKKDKHNKVSGIKVFGSVMLDNSHMAISLQDKDGYMIYICNLSNNSNEPQEKIPTNTYSIDKFFIPKDINDDSLNDLISYQDYAKGRLNIFYQKENFLFESDFSEDINSTYPLTSRSLSNAFISDIDNDGSLEIITVNGENKFSYINFK